MCVCVSVSVCVCVGARVCVVEGRVWHLARLLWLYRLDSAYCERVYCWSGAADALQREWKGNILYCLHIEACVHAHQFHLGAIASVPAALWRHVSK